MVGVVQYAVVILQRRGAVQDRPAQEHRQDRGRFRFSDQIRGALVLVALVVVLVRVDEGLRNDLPEITERDLRVGLVAFLGFPAETASTLLLGRHRVRQDMLDVSAGLVGRPVAASSRALWSVHVVRADFDVVDEMVGEIDRRGQMVCRSHLTIHDELEMVCAWAEL